MSHVADIMWGNIQSFEKTVEVNSCTFVYGKVYNFRWPRRKTTKNNEEDYPSNAQKLQFHKAISFEYFRKLTDL